MAAAGAEVGDMLPQFAGRKNWDRVASSGCDPVPSAREKAPTPSADNRPGGGLALRMHRFSASAFRIRPIACGSGPQLLATNREPILMDARCGECHLMRPAVRRRAKPKNREPARRECQRERRKVRTTRIRRQLVEPRNGFLGGGWSMLRP